ncbi:MAG: hypothetical protein F6K35_49245, partial [Okeania sp. SIO2H7]|nr:hypothetical protein [Okeania sp. SIO2H7]
IQQVKQELLTQSPDVDKGTIDFPLFFGGGTINLPLPDELIGVVQGVEPSALTISGGSDITTII